MYVYQTPTVEPAVLSRCLSGFSYIALAFISLNLAKAKLSWVYTITLQKSNHVVKIIYSSVYGDYFERKNYLMT